MCLLKTPSICVKQTEGGPPCDKQSFHMGGGFSSGWRFGIFTRCLTMYCVDVRGRIDLVAANWNDRKRGPPKKCKMKNGDTAT